RWAGRWIALDVSFWSGPGQQLHLTRLDGIHQRVELGELGREGHLHRWKSKAGLGVEIERGDPKTDGETLALPLRKAEQTHELADVRREASDVVVVVTPHGWPEATQQLHRIEPQ